MVTKCSNCGNEYKWLGQHWAKSSECGFPEITDKQKQVIQGLLLGDATVEDRGTSGRFSIQLVNKEFIEWIDDVLGVLSLGYTSYTNGDDQKEKVKEQGYLDVKDHHDFNKVYELKSRSHPYFKELYQWYDSGEKTIPSDFSMTSLKAKMWYVCDGSLVKSDAQRPHSRIYSSKSEDEIKRFVGLFEDFEIQPKKYTGAIGFTADGTEQFLDWLGKPPSGMSYKWIKHDT